MTTADRTEPHTSPWIVGLLLAVSVAAIGAQLFFPQSAAGAVKPWDRPSWGAGDGRNDGRNTRNEIIAERCVRVEWRGGAATRATCRDQYSGEISTRKATGFQVDHVYAAVVAWRARAWRQADGSTCWKAAGCREFVAFFNDQRNLQVTTAHENMSKGSKGPGEWCPSLRGARMLLAKRYRATAVSWRLPISAKDARGLDAWSRGECVKGRPGR